MAYAVGDKIYYWNSKTESVVEAVIDDIMGNAYRVLNSNYNLLVTEVEISSHSNYMSYSPRNVLEKLRDDYNRVINNVTSALDNDVFSKNNKGRICISKSS